jgi:hypothetical protein
MKGKKAIQSKVGTPLTGGLSLFDADSVNNQFPTARIKKIMQEDEEIGKVAAGAPIVICSYD